MTASRRTLRLVFALIAAAAIAAAALASPVFLRAYLLGWVLWLGVALGGFSFLCVHHLVHGRWGEAVRPLLEAAARTIPVLAVLFVPIALGLPRLYAWADAAYMQAEPLRAAKAGYLSPGFFLVRAALVLVAWSALAWALARARTLRPGLAALSLVTYFLTGTTAAVDWVLSLDAGMSSSAFGLHFIAGNAVAGWSFVLIVLALLEGRAGRRQVATERVHELGTLLFVAVMLWGYVAFAQFLLIWSADLPRQAYWYVQRTSGGWAIVAWALVGLHFAAPFVLLLFRAIKRRPGRLAMVAALLLVMHGVELVWLIAPSRPVPPAGGSSVHVLDVVLPLVLGLVYVALYFALLPRGRGSAPGGEGDAGA
ncbi:MAG TPA: hypothetical protein VIK91_18515 [Nannocystis sp.]